MLTGGADQWGAHTATAAVLFDADSRLHGPLLLAQATCSFLEGQRRLDRSMAERRCREHLMLIDRLLAGPQEAAADFVRLHLCNAVREKSDS
ncbi:GntR family transcriptional regulator (fragment) (plasmid) [Cupriavidus taiwanensis]|uniref:GntR family transcriptional regulator n=1 Tax=Cupriavidus taiwanensis TaxID=164546 RepID=A0A375FHA1_9BURK